MSPNAVWPSSALPASRDESRDSKYNKAALDRRDDWLHDFPGLVAA